MDFVGVTLTRTVAEGAGAVAIKVVEEGVREVQVWTEEEVKETAPLFSACPDTKRTRLA